MLTGDQISALAVAASWSRAAQPLEAAGWQEGMWLEFHFPNFEAAIYSCSCCNALMTKNFLKNPSTQPNPAQKIHKLPNPKTKEKNPH